MWTTIIIKSMIVEPADGCALVHATDKASRVRDHFSSQFTGKPAGEIPPPPSLCTLATPISESEVVTALKPLQIGVLAVQIKNPSGAIVRYGSGVLALVIADLVNITLSQGARFL
eukprot:scpid102793/ scgid14100/ 